MGMLLNNTPWHMPVTEKPVLNTTEIWELVNLTDDSHPIHLHLVSFQILDRRPFDTFEFQDKGTVRFFGPALPPDANESGWKDTVRADPGMITRIIIPFEGLRRALRVALPHPGTRGQRNDAAVRGAATRLAVSLVKLTRVALSRPVLA